MITSTTFEPNEQDNDLIGRIVLRPNQSLSWSAFKYFLLFIMLLSFGIATAFLVAGYWLILPFTGLEMAVLSYCLLLCIRRTSTQEVLSFGANDITLEVGRDQPDQVVRWQRFFTKIHVKRAVHPWYRKNIFLVHKGEEKEIGKFLTQIEQEELIDQLNAMIRRADLAQVQRFPQA